MSSAAPPLPVFCLPFAGGGASVYLRWPACDGVRIRPVQLPGREERLMEAPLQDMDLLAAQLQRELAPYMAQPYALFGCSMGALLAYRLCVRLRAVGAALPQRLFVAASAPPQRMRAPQWHTLPDDALIERVLALGGTPAEVFDEPLLRNIALPLLRADFAAVANCPRECVPLPCPITALAGVDDHHAPLDEMAHWRDCTSGHFELDSLEGGHFFIRSQGAALGARLAGALARP
jgi:surfactin synthase thioesterase subunit